MINLAGRYANVISRNPIASAVAGGLGAAGLATLGNIVSGQAAEEGPGRLGIEALGAGALGTALGTQIPSLRGRAALAMRNVGAVGLQNPGAVARRAKMSPAEIQSAEFANAILNSAVQEGADPNTLRRDLKTNMRRGQTLINTAGIPLGLTAAGGLGGMIGGGTSDLAQFIGVPGFTDQRIDPESYGSSNSPGARYKQTTGTTGISNYQR
jgi:hypothetical protein